MKVRFRFEKLGTARFLSHLEMQDVWQRAFKRARIPVKLSQGFNPHPLFSFGSALAVGTASICEYLDVELDKEVPLIDIKEKVNASLPEGFKITEIKSIKKKAKSLMAIINRAEYEILQKLEKCPENLQQLKENFLNQEEIKVIRNTKSGTKIKDIKPGIFDFQVDCKDSELSLKILVQTGSQGNIRPHEVLNAFIAFTGIKPVATEKITRTGLYVEKKGKLVTPLDF